MDEKIKLKEKVQHGSPMFPINVYGNLFVPENNPVLPHWHDEFEIIYLEKGLASFAIDGQEYRLLPHQFLFVNCGSIHSGKAIDSPEAYAIVFNLNMLYSGESDICKSKYLQLIETRKLLVPHFVEDISLRDLIFNLIRIWKEKRCAYELFVKSNLFMIFYNLFAKGYIVSNSYDKEFNWRLEKIKSALDYISSNYAAPLKIEDLSRITNLSKYYFCRLFKEITHLTPIDYINKFRVEKAIELIKNTNLSISEIAFEVGFDNVSYFIKVFKEHVGVTPLQYKKRV
ncbi:transcriptional regulator, AraC family [Caldicellulosiruptor hydrothermalis 108]|uniref:Transcriptional regulator, AraC family n=1 Tax=Caldicellulosiruptor hydrothermalis (strain DSM 18901 / VKM B-2411 / 108) TaxID=632292 RepID=E4QDL8_CALH1|nr:AraC family transcriptional regulator [Caldicellulosiruptor hydrothermalis]ADQ06435.1 transcriptional regulator, AraC family [Caldicellulosiruptor hydrothermalis 108]